MSTNNSFIEVNYENNEIKINSKKNGNPLVSTTGVMPTFNFTDQILSSMSQEKVQLVLRKLDCLKDAKEGEGITEKIDIMNKIFNTGISNDNKLDLNSIKQSVFKQNEDKIASYSWLKSSSLNENLSFIKNVFFETGLAPKSYIKNFKNPSEKVFEMIGNFQNEIGDPFLRKTEDITIRYPEEVNTRLIFNESFMNYFGFLNVTYESTLVGVGKNGGIYNYTYNLGNGNSYNSNNITKVKNSGTSMNRFSSSVLPKQVIEVCNDSYKIEKVVTGDEYFKGNDYKNAVINAFYKNNSNNNLPEIKRYIIGKELGDVMQILLMMVWQITENIEKKNYCMVSLDSIVFLLCNLLEQPCFYTHNSNKGKSVEDKCYGIQYFFPTVISPSERMKMRFEQKYNEIFSNNLKIKNFLNRIFIEGIIYVGSTAVDYKSDRLKRSIIEKNFIGPINDTITKISEDLENFYNGLKNSDNIQEYDLMTMNKDYLLLPFIGVIQSNAKNTKKTISKYYLKGDIRNYTYNLPLVYTDGKNYSFKDLFLKLKSGSLRGGTITEEANNIVSPTTNDHKETKKNDSGDNLPTETEENVLRIDKFSPQESKSSSVVTDTLEKNEVQEEKDPVIRLEKLSESPIKSDSINKIEDDDNEKEKEMDNLEEQLKDNLEREDEIINEGNNEMDVENAPEMDVENAPDMDLQSSANVFMNSFTDSLYLNFINQIVEFIENQSNGLVFDDDEDIFYYYYDMICYICYIQKQVYYDDNLLNLMKQLKLYSSENQISIQEIIENNPSSLPFLETSDEISSNINSCNINNPVIYNPNSKKYFEELFETLDSIDSEPLNDVVINIPSIEPSIGSKRLRETESDEDFANFKKGRGGKTIKIKKTVKKHRKTRKGGSHKSNKKRSMKKKASRRKRKTVKKRL